jgi:hypothetical protein
MNTVDKLFAHGFQIVSVMVGPAIRATLLVIV